MVSEPPRERRGDVLLDPSVAGVVRCVAEGWDVTTQPPLLIRRVNEVPDALGPGGRRAPRNREVPLEVVEQPLDRGAAHGNRLASRASLDGINGTNPSSMTPPMLR